MRAFYFLILILVTFYIRNFVEASGGASLPAVGVEIEARVNKQQTPDLIAGSAYSYLRRFSPVRMLGQGTLVDYELTYTDDKQIQHVEVKLETSGIVADSSSNRLIEITSPKMSSDLHIDHFIDLMMHLKSQHQLVSSIRDGSGLHVHVDFAQPTREEVKLLYRLFAVVEKFILAAASPQPGRMKYFESIKKGWQASQQGEHPLFFDRPMQFFPGKDYTLNFFSAQLFHNTVEFRLFDSTLDPDLIRAYVGFSRHLVYIVRRQPETVRRFLAGPAPKSFQDIDSALNLGLLQIVKIRSVPTCGRVFGE